MVATCMKSHSSNTKQSSFGACILAGRTVCPRLSRSVMAFTSRTPLLVYITDTGFSCIPFDKIVALRHPCVSRHWHRPMCMEKDVCAGQQNVCGYRTCMDVCLVPLTSCGTGASRPLPHSSGGCAASCNVWKSTDARPSSVPCVRVYAYVLFRAFG